MNDKLSQLAKSGKQTEFFNEYQKTYPNAKVADISAAYNFYRTTDNTAATNQTSSTSTVAGATATVPQGILQTVREGLKSQSGKDYGSSSENATIESSINMLFDANNKLKSLGDIAKDAVGKIGTGIVDNYKQQNALLQDINSGTMMTGELSKAFREEITEAYPDAQRLGISFQDLSTTMSNLVANSGRFRLVNAETIRDMELSSKFVEGGMDGAAQMANDFQRVSMGVKDTMEYIQDASKSSLTLGLNSKETISRVGQNIGLLNQYGFKNGIEGLTKMAQKAQSLKMDFSMVTALADKAFEPEGAMELAAQLSAVGGAYGAMNDPLKLMYMTTNDMNGLQDALAGTVKGLATFNQSTGRFEVTGANLRQVRAIATATGQDFKQLSDLAVNSAQRMSAASELMSTGLVMDDDDREFLTNMSQMKDGKMVIEVPKSLQAQLGGSTVALESLSGAQKDILLNQREAFKKMSAEEIATKQVSAIENINRDVSFIAAKARVEAGKLGDSLVKSLGFDPYKMAMESREVADKVAKGTENTANVIRTIATDIFSSAKDTKTKTNVSGKQEPINVKEETKKTETKIEPTTQNKGTKSEVELKITSSGTLTDGIMREMFKDDYFQSQVKGSYLNIGVPSS
jgi:hypothetical protein